MGAGGGGRKGFFKRIRWQRRIAIGRDSHSKHDRHLFPERPGMAHLGVILAEYDERADISDQKNK